MVNIIIVTYNGVHWIDKCLGSIKNQPLVSNTIVIDNGSTDGTIEQIRLNFPEVRLILNPENRGFGQSNNQGFKICLGEECKYVFLLNQDAWLTENTIAGLVNIHHEQTCYGILSPMHLRGDGQALDMKFATFLGQSENHELISDLYTSRQEMNPVYSVPFINAAAWLISRDCFERVGGFAPIYHHYGEDMDYANRVLYHGFKIGICPNITIFHDRKNIITFPNINKPTEYLKLKKIWHLIYLTDIRHPLVTRYLKLLAITSKHIVKSLLRLKTAHLRIYLAELKTLACLYPKVHSNNSVTKKPGPSFLS